MLRPVRTREHYLADLSLNYLERYILLSGHTAEVPVHDYGYDLEMTTFDYGGDYHYNRGAVENGVVYFQVKATDHLKVTADGARIHFPVDRRHVELWVGEPMPVIFIVYDASQEEAYWLYVQRAIAAWESAAGNSKTITLHLSVDNKVDLTTIETFRMFKTVALDRIRTRLNLYE